MNFDIVNEYCLKKHSVLPNTQLNDIEDISRNHLGLHSARIMTPFMTLCSRVNNFKPDNLISDLYVEKKIIKLRCMRTTLHIVPIDMASIFHKATLDIRLSDCKLFFKKNNINDEKIYFFKNILSEFITYPRTSYEIECEIKKYIDFGDEIFKKNFSKKLLKYYWEIGFLCYVNTARCWEKEDRKYGLTKLFYPNINFDLYDIDIAKEKLIMEYIKVYGPATLKDIVWWSGISANDIKKILNNNINLIHEIEIDGYILYMLETEYPNLINYSPLKDDWVALLAYEDPALKAYYETRHRYVDSKYYNLLFNQIGEVRASIIYNGKAIGVWEWDKKLKNIKITYFYKVPKKIQQLVQKKKKMYESMLYPNQQLSLWDI